MSAATDGYQLQPIGRWNAAYVRELPATELDWLEDKIPGIVEPRLPAIEVQTIPASKGSDSGIVVVHIPPSADAPHQATDHKFYQRCGSRLVPLPRRSIFDVANRQKHPDLTVVIKLILHENDSRDEPRSKLYWELTNVSKCLCRHFSLRVRVPADYDGKCLYVNGAHVRTEGGLFYTEFFINSGIHPLLPLAAKFGTLVLKNDGQWRNEDRSLKEYKTIRKLEVRVWADAAPYRDFEFSVADIVTRVPRQQASGFE